MPEEDESRLDRPVSVSSSAPRCSPDQTMPRTGSETPADHRQANSSKLHTCPSHIPQSAKQTQQLVGMYQGDDFNPEQGVFFFFFAFGKVESIYHRMLSFSPT